MRIDNDEPSISEKMHYALIDAGVKAMDSFPADDFFLKYKLIVSEYIHKIEEAHINAANSKMVFKEVA